VLRRREYCDAFSGVRRMASVGLFERSQDGSAPLRVEVGMKRQNSRPCSRGTSRCERPPSLLRCTSRIRRLVSQMRAKMWDA
jgi:hypothetical protein